jgi:hypothetical protein
MSFHNQLLWNRALVNGETDIQVMLAVPPEATNQAASRAEALGGQIRYTDRNVGYLRVRIPVSRFASLVGDSSVEAFQISSHSMAAWYRDGVPRSNAEMFRRYEVRPPRGDSVAKPDKSLPVLTVEASRAPGFTADDDTGVGTWLERHPTYDGRGVMVALMESGTPEFTHPTMRSARALDGSEVRKIGGIVDTVDPDETDETRVELGKPFEAVTAWHRENGRTYILPARGTFRFGVFEVVAGANIVQRFGVLRNESTREIWVDSDGDADFRNEHPMEDVNRKFDVGVLKLLQPEPAQLRFVVLEGRHPDTVHILPARSGHQAMTASVAAGSKTEDGLAFGVAPSARVLFVRSTASDFRLQDIVEGYLQIAARTDVDVLTDSAGITVVPDTQPEFLGLIFKRVAERYGKPIFHSAGNFGPLMNSASSMDGLFSVGGAIGPKTYAALYGGASIPALSLHPMSATGPSLDGALKPDFLAPMHRLAADSCVRYEKFISLPRNAPQTGLPACYQISCCTSASSPYAAGVAALILSAARQEHIPYSLERLSRALRISSRFLPGWQAYQQGNGVLDVNAAWEEYKRDGETPKIRISGSVVEPLAGYSIAGNQGPGLFEREGWTAGDKGVRTLHFETVGTPREYRLTLTGNDGTFSLPDTLSLAAGKGTDVPVRIQIANAGVHSAMLSVEDPRTRTTVARTALTVVAPERFDEKEHAVHFHGAVPLMGTREHYWAVPSGAGDVRIDLEVQRGSMAVRLLAPHTLYPSYYDQVFPPTASRVLPKGHYSFTLPRPLEGTWGLALGNESAWREDKRELVSLGPAEYRFTIHLQKAGLTLTPHAANEAAVNLTNDGAAMESPVLELSSGGMRKFSDSFREDGQPNRFEIDVPADTSTLALHGQAVSDGGLLDMHLYDCTTGQCFSHDFTLPAKREQWLIVRKPDPGRWVVAINAAPLFPGNGRLVLEQTLTGAVTRRSLGGPLSPGASVAEQFAIPRSGPVPPDAVPVLLCELMDAANENAENQHPWADPKDMVRLKNRPAAAASVIWKLDQPPTR